MFVLLSSRYCIFQHNLKNPCKALFSQGSDPLYLEETDAKKHNFLDNDDLNIDGKVTLSLDQIPKPDQSYLTILANSVLTLDYSNKKYSISLYLPSNLLFVSHDYPLCVDSVRFSDSCSFNRLLPIQLITKKCSFGTFFQPQDFIQPSSLVIEELFELEISNIDYFNHIIIDSESLLFSGKTVKVSSPIVFRGNGFCVLTLNQFPKFPISFQFNSVRFDESWGVDKTNVTVNSDQIFDTTNFTPHCFSSFGNCPKYSKQVNVLTQETFSFPEILVYESLTLEIDWAIFGPVNPSTFHLFNDSILTLDVKNMDLAKPNKILFYSPNIIINGCDPAYMISVALSNLRNHDSTSSYTLLVNKNTGVKKIIQSNSQLSLQFLAGFHKIRFGKNQFLLDGCVFQYNVTSLDINLEAYVNSVIDISADSDSSEIPLSLTVAGSTSLILHPSKSLTKMLYMGGNGLCKILIDDDFAIKEFQMQIYTGVYYDQIIIQELVQNSIEHAYKHSLFHSVLLLFAFS